MGGAVQAASLRMGTPALAGLRPPKIPVPKLNVVMERERLGKAVMMATRQVVMGAHQLAKWSPVLDAMAAAHHKRTCALHVETARKKPRSPVMMEILQAAMAVTQSAEKKKGGLALQTAERTLVQRTAAKAAEAPCCLVPEHRTFR